MTRSKKRKQITQYVGNTTLAPELRDDESENKRIGKRIKIMHEISYLPFFTRSMTEKLNSLIISKIRKSDSKTLEKNIKKLKEYIINRKTLPPGLLQQASEYANEAILRQTGEQSTLTSAAYKNRLDNEVPRKLIDIWNEYATEDRFDTIVNQEKSRVNVAFREQGSSSTAAQGLHSSVSREEVLQYRTCPVSFEKIIRKDLPDAVNNAVRSKLTDAIENSSDFQAHFLSIIEMFTIIFKTHGLSMDSGAIRTSVDILDILPNNFIKDKQLKSTLSASPLPERVKLKYKDELISLFTEQHLKLIQSYYFGARGSSEENLEKHPLQNLLFEIMASEGIQRGSFKQKCKSEEMTNVMTNIITNIKNMWSANNIFQKLLDKVLLVLLRQHLAPQRETLKQEEVKKKKRDKAHPSLHKRNVVHYEKKKLKKLTKKLNNADPQERAKLVERFEKSKVRVKNFQRLPKSAFSMKANTDNKTTATTGNLKQEDQPKKGETKKKWPEKEEKPNEALDEFVKDATSARILAVRSVLKHMLLYDPSCTASLLKERLYEATEKEIATIKLLFKFFKPYIPQKEDRLSIGHQLPLCILANDVLSILDYAKFVRKLFPVPKFSRLHALEVNSTALYQILTARPSPLKIADFDHFEIESTDFARSNVAAVMNSIFDLNVVNQVCESHRLVFANRIMVMPGLKTARLLGTRKDIKNSLEEPSAPSLVDRILTNTSIVEEAKKEFNVLKREVDTLETNLKTLQNDLKILLKKNEPLELSAKIKEKKKERNNCEDQGLRGEMLAEIVLLKNKRFEEYRKIQASQKAVSDAKQSLHFRRMAMRYHHRLRRSAPATTDPEERPELSKNTIGLFKATECNIKKPADFVFSGTDNGLVNMSTTTPFTLDRFKFHLKLYNRYQVLSEENVEIDESDDEVEQFFKLPKPSVINAADVDIGCGYRKVRLKLEREKKSSTSGKAVSDAEKELSKKPLNVNLTIPEYLENKEVHVGQSATIRNFYGSSKRATKSRTVEIQKQKFTNRLVSKEKESIKKTVGKRKIVQFVGDRGTGVGSRIKGFRKYGGKWLEVLRSYQNIVCITNEHNTSQLCIYCFEKVCHPRSSNKKTSKGALQCVNPGCVSVKAGKAVKSRDALSSLAIGLSGLCSCLLGVTMPHFSPNKISQFDTDNFKNISLAFVKEEQERQ